MGKQTLNVRDGLRREVDSLMYWISYLDACSFGKTPDFINSLEKMSENLRNIRSLLCKLR